MHCSANVPASIYGCICGMTDNSCTGSMLPHEVADTSRFSGGVRIEQEDEITNRFLCTKVCRCETEVAVRLDKLSSWVLLLQNLESRRRGPVMNDGNLDNPILAVR